MNEQNSKILKKFYLESQKHPFHLVDASPLPFMLSMCVLVVALGLVEYMHFSIFWPFVVGFVCFLVVLFMWFTDTVKEGTFGGYHTRAVVSNLRLGFFLFVTTEVMFFFSFFWSFFHFGLSPSIFIGMQWPPSGFIVISANGWPFFNTALLLFSSYLVTYAHRGIVSHNWYDVRYGLFFSIVIGFLFLIIQGYEYVTAPFSMDDTVLGSIFFLLTGCHGLHVFIGTFFLLFCFVRNELKQFTSEHHLGFEAAAIYWHFVDAVWLFVFLFVYVWSNGF